MVRVGKSQIHLLYDISPRYLRFNEKKKTYKDFQKNVPFFEVKTAQTVQESLPEADEAVQKSCFLRNIFLRQVRSWCIQSQIQRNHLRIWGPPKSVDKCHIVIRVKCENCGNPNWLLSIHTSWAAMSIFPFLLKPSPGVLHGLSWVWLPAFPGNHVL